MHNVLTRPITDRIFFDMPETTPADLVDPIFNAIYEATKDWDVGAPKHHGGHTGMTGSHVMIIVNAIRAEQRKQAQQQYRGSHFRRMDPQPEGGAVSWRPGWQSLISGSATYRIGRQLFSAPDDMPAAKPWRDRDGEWYWRTELRG